MRYTNELNRAHKIFGLDLNSFLFVFSMYGIVVMTTLYSLFICVPLFFIFLMEEKKANRGFVRHALYALGVDKAEGYPPINITLFHQ
ncbi:hypothetical protein BGC33_13720 [Bathymodiolus thermophilus thioautotrophic gill symbiont]|uniref:Uncharacterized protein n=1 Tax=Bathymodiolus thermophilus thioautotrophic gill symbiont TaxID=2360 RepID=A0A1J5UI95_9GAMM|nr:hypothetical protein BGC33_13720 [Bathymodiolus thermophilus thioautotrophic gill symbiont]